MGFCGIVAMGHCASHWVPPVEDNPLGCQPATLCSDKTCLLAPGPLLGEADVLC